MTQALWFFLGLPVLRSSVIPSSRIRVFLLRIFGARIGDGVVLKPGIRVKYPWLLSLGDRSWIGEDVWIDNLANVTIGSDVCISQGAYFCTGNHDWSDGAFGLIVKPIVLENGSWVGARSMICPGVTVHECGIAAAGSVVSKDVPAFEIHAGNPATLVRIREFRSTGKRPAAPRTVTSGVS
jgi:putative colanic acid biosynthesis acetyltransferase WcaF